MADHRLCVLFCDIESACTALISKLISKSRESAKLQYVRFSFSLVRILGGVGFVGGFGNR